MVNYNVAAAVAHKRTGVEGVDEFEGGEVIAAAGAREWFGDPSCADAVGDVDYAGEFFEFGEEGNGDVGCLSGGFIGCENW